MNRCFRLLAIALVGGALAACEQAPQNSWQGWIEGDLIFVGPDESGRVEALSVREGDTVQAGEPLFVVDSELQQSDLKVAEAVLVNAKQAFERADKLLKSNTGSQRAYDEAQADLREAEAKMVAARTRLARRQLSSPVNGIVQRVYYRPGEMVPAGRPVVALLPPGNVKVRFYVSQALLPKIRIDQAVRVQCDGCAQLVDAKVSFIANEAEYTPPVIYSQQERSKLVYLIEALPAQPTVLRVGQPVSVTFVE